MKTTIEIPDETFGTLLRLTRAKTKRDAILAAIEDYNRRHQAEALVATFGKWKMDSNEEMEAADMEEAGTNR
jgi:Bacterial antitoxin of type II TA system, VapB